MKKVELLAPAGNLEKLKIAILYGADAVFIGGKTFSLRAKANNFEKEDLKEAVVFANKHHAKVYITVNIIPEDEDFENLDNYLLFLDNIGVHAIIVSSLSVIIRAKKLNCHFEIHISTQQSITNVESINFFESLGADRVVLARELNIEQIKNIKKTTKIPIEIFIHGGMCSSFSGRCTLSNLMANRDANKGGCAHSCRWIYKLYQNNKLIDDHNFIIASKDLMSIDYIPQLIDCKVESFKIEGRMKSTHYIAGVVNVYRRLIDEYYNNHQKISNERLNYYKKELKKVENRITGTGFFNKNNCQNLLKNTGYENPTQSFLAYSLKNSDKKNYVLVEQRNWFKKGMSIEVFDYKNGSRTTKIIDIKNLDNESIDVAIHPKQLLKIKTDIHIIKDSFIRKK